MFDAGHDSSRIHWIWSEHVGKHLHSWILQAPCDFTEVKAKGEKEADEDKNVDILSDSREISLYS